MSDLRGVMAVFKSYNVKQVKWECCTDSGWVAYSAGITALLESGHKVYTVFAYLHNVLSWQEPCRVAIVNAQLYIVCILVMHACREVQCATV
jgi:hypothetical protein